ncbi:hypothetical protein HMPREF9333_00044 [Johnsonella ignava ATCC 51276]|uniref:Ferritin/DPS domain-containing protein n=1 Tax=Johnsonella ignava ATCC 51276 TaxID=679200 RepID=G5GEQ6_9FIRM|nr:DNA starvation/stationary phase protection protein [Johnsonella ignava]EHI56794.1 hypothetical protein HMPREF9333_00044 [Johnsonella ignava ATCC 51276]
MSKKLNDKMNVYLANQEVMYIKLHNLHWYVKGKSFFTLHAKFEELYDQAAEILDEVAERLLSLGESPIASFKKALSATAVKELDDVPVSSVDAVKILLKDVEYWIKDTKEIADLADDEGDKVTSDMFNGYLKEYQKLDWMLKSYVE